MTTCRSLFTFYGLPPSFIYVLVYLDLTNKERFYKMEMTGSIRIPSISHIIDLQITGKGFAAFKDIEILRLRSKITYECEYPLYDPNTPIFSCKFCPENSNNHILAICNESGDVTLINSRKPSPVIKHFRAHNNAVFDLAWMPPGKKYLTMSGDHSARLYDVGQASTDCVSVFNGHTKSVKTGDFMPTDPAVFATGARDGNIIIWDSRSAKHINNIFSPDQIIANGGGRGLSSHSNSITGVLFTDNYNLLSCGSCDQFIRIYDMRKTHCAWKESTPKAIIVSKRHGFTDIKVNAERTKLYASNINHNICCFNLNSENKDPIAEFTGHLAGTFYVKMSISDDGRYLVSGSTDGMLHIWCTEKSERAKEPIKPIAKLSGHNAEITGVDIMRYGRTMIASSGDDGTVRTWTPEAPDLDRELSSYSSRLSDLSLETQRGRVLQRTPPRRPLAANQIRASSAKRKLAETSPSEKTDLKRQQNATPPKDFQSPTMNLPNFVVDGAGPSHSCSRSNHKENKQDWLTELKQISASKSPQSITQKPRRKSQQGKPTSRKTLLSYYKKTNKGTEETQKI